ncbi:MAG: hypothetical protein D6731_15725 [Planctomycetota bacterium]|nr:MAG: hypothetical protein D6731_15725 [Planctomycetota bacterium]
MGFMSTTSAPQGGFQAPPDVSNLQGPSTTASNAWSSDPYAGARFGGAPAMGPIQTHGWDQTSKGEGEQYFGLNQARWMAPGTGAQWWHSQGEKFNEPTKVEKFYENRYNAFQQPTNAQQFFDAFRQQDPGLGAYYERAKERQAADINQQMAARGGFGSSAAVDHLSQALTDLEAQRANREADYMLQQQALGAQLANQADLRNQALLGLGAQVAGQASNTALNRLGQAGQLALGVDAADLARLNAGMNAATNAQQLRRQRARDYISDLFNPAAFLSNMQLGAMNAALSNDQELLASVIEGMLGQQRETVNQDYQNQAAHRGDLGIILDMVGSIMGGGGKAAAAKGAG